MHMRVVADKLLAAADVVGGAGHRGVGHDVHGERGHVRRGDHAANGQLGNDIGASYRSAIFYTDDQQRLTAQDTIADFNASGLWPGEVVTEVAPAGPFWEAEPEHQDYLERYPGGYTCHFVRPAWKLPHRNEAVSS
jgi:peptide-methionine (S)-S-oxide reductase